jgi:uncharacterized membrane protein HdeD (DUF308 family)
MSTNEPANQPSNQPLNQLDWENMQKTVAEMLHKHWVLYLVEGIVLVVLGAAAILIPPLATLVIAAFIGWLLFISGVVGLILTFELRHAPGFWWSLLSAVLALVAGIVLIAWPAQGAVSLTLVLIVFFLLEGVATIMFALEHRRELPQWGFLVASGIIDLIIGAIISAGLPESATWALALLVGINLLFGGSAMIAMALHARAVKPDATTPPG